MVKKLAVKMTPVFVLWTRHVDDAPCSAFSGSVTAKLVEKRLRIEAI
jgi:hypothetical protein